MDVENRFLTPFAVLDAFLFFCLLGFSSLRRQRKMGFFKNRFFDDPTMPDQHKPVKGGFGFLRRVQGEKSGSGEAGSQGIQGFDNALATKNVF